MQMLSVSSMASAGRRSEAGSKMARVPIRIGGKTLLQIEKETGISNQTLRARYNAGYSEAAIVSPSDLRQCQSDVVLTIGDQSGTIKQWSEATGKPYIGIYQRVRDGKTGYEAVYGTRALRKREQEQEAEQCKS